MKFVQTFQSIFIKFRFFDILYFLFSFSIFALFYDHLQSDTMYSPTPGASMDAPDAPCPMPMHVSNSFPFL